MEKDFAEIGALIADRHTFFRRGMFGLLQESRPGWRLAEAGTFDEAWTHLQNSDPELLLLDLDLPNLEGADGIRRLRALCPVQRIVVMADSDARETILECLAAGAQGYVLKSATSAQFLRALETVLSGGVFAPASLTGDPLRAPAGVRRNYYFGKVAGWVLWLTGARKPRPLAVHVEARREVDRQRQPLRQAGVLRREPHRARLALDRE